MKIALIVKGGLHPSGREQVIPSLLALLERLTHRHEVHAVALHHLTQAQHYTLAGASVHDLGRPRGRWGQFRRLMRALRTHGPFDALHGYWADPAGLVTVMAGRRLGVPTVVSCDSGEFASFPDYQYGLQRTTRHRLIVSYACGRASIVHVASEYMQALARAHGIAATCIPLGIDLTPFIDAPTRTEGPPWTALQVASLNRIKDHTLLLRAVALVRQNHDLRLHLAGADTLSGELQREALALGIGDAVAFHGFVPQSQLPVLYQRAHIYVQSSRHEAAGVSVLEAAASGLPIVGTHVGYVSDWSGGAAVSVTPGDAEALAAALTAMICNPARRERFGQAARDRVRHYDADLTAAAMTTLYESLGAMTRRGR